LNFNDFLVSVGMSPLTRDLEKKFTMLVKNFDDTSWGKVNPYPCIIMEKMDGVCTLAVNVFGKWHLFSRTGRKLQNVAHLERLLEAKGVGRNCVLSVELCNDDLSLEQISGIVNPNRVEPVEPELQKLWVDGAYMAAFDVVGLDSFLEGKSFLRFDVRLCFVKDFVKRGLPCVVPIHDTIESESEADEFFNRVVAKGGEGVVQCLPDAPWKAGNKNREKTKKVRGVDFDLEVIDVVEGKGKRANTMGKLVVRFRAFGVPTGKVEHLPVDGRFDDATRAKYWADPSLILGKIVHVHALQIGSKGSLRLAKVRSVRIDKHEADL